MIEAFWMVVIPAGITTIFLEKLKVLHQLNLAELSFGTVGLVFVNYWRIDTVFARKWKYCADLYNKNIEFSLNLYTPVQNGSDELRKIKVGYSEAVLALDLIHLDLWAKRSFKNFFRSVMVEVVGKNQERTEKKETEIRSDGKTEKISDMDLLLAGEFSERDAEIQIRDYLKDARRQIEELVSSQE